MSEENEFNMYKNIVNNYFRTETFEKAKEFCARDMVQLNQRYITEAVCKNEALNRADKLQKENEEYQELTDNLRGENAELRDKLNKLKSEYEVLEILHETYDGKHISKDIIENKIKELEENLDDDMFRYETMAAINVLKELLGE